MRDAFLWIDIWDVVDYVEGGKPIHELVTADESRGYVMAVMTDVVQSRQQYDSIVLFEDFAEVSKNKQLGALHTLGNKKQSP